MMRFGLGVPTGTEGTMYPVPYADADQAVELAREAERLGFESIWGNDHVTTQRYVREAFEQPPRFYDPFSYLSYVAAVTERIRLATAVMVLPFRNPVIAAKQATTLSHLSHGRFVLGVGIGAYREELLAIDPNSRVNRGEYAEEAITALQKLFTDRRASFHGSLVQFDDVECHPKPYQSMLPILSGGNSGGSRSRAARLADGWLPACLSQDEVRSGLREIREEAARNGRVLPGNFEVALQVAVSIGRTREQARKRFESSQVFHHLRSLSRSTLRDQGTDDLLSRNLVGTVEQVQEQIHAYQEAGVNTLAALLFATDTVEETRDAMAEFSADVMRVGGPST